MIVLAMYTLNIFHPGYMLRDLNDSDSESLSTTAGCPENHDDTAKEA